MTPEQLLSKISLKNAKNISGGILLLLLSVVLWPITYLVTLFISALFWIAVARIETSSTIFITSFVLFVLLGGYGVFRAHAIYTDERLERATLGDGGFSPLYLLGGGRLAMIWGITMCAPKITWMGIHQIRERLSPSPATLNLAVKLYNEMVAEQSWRLLPNQEPQRSAAVLLVKLELLRCSPNKQNGFDIRVPSKNTDW